MGKKIRFGGQSLRKGQKTWFERVSNGRHEQVFAAPGDVHEADTVVRVLGKKGGKFITEPRADYYVENGLAEYVRSSPPRSREASE